MYIYVYSHTHTNLTGEKLEDGREDALVACLPGKTTKETSLKKTVFTNHKE